VTVTGYVEDVRPYLDRASVFVCPMRKGAGIKNKILQAWAMGKPVVCTSIALAGLHANPEENVIVADNSDHFAAQVVRLLKDESLRKAVGERAKRTVRDRYSWRQQAELLEATVKVS
jgi:polysaccharide biosynthesis protein PslH